MAISRLRKRTALGTPQSLLRRYERGTARAPSFEEYARAKEAGRTGPGPIPAGYKSLLPPQLQTAYMEGYRGTHPQQNGGGPQQPPAASAGPTSLSPGQTAARLQADRLYNDAASSAGRNIYEAALRYGDRGALEQYSQYGPVVDNPNSALSTIDRQRQERSQAEAGAQNLRGTFFSGLHQKAQQDVEDAADRARTEAYQEFLNAQEAYRQAVRNASTQREGTYGETSAQALEDFLGTEPEDPGKALAPERPTPKSTKPKPKPKKKSKKKGKK